MAKTIKTTRTDKLKNKFRFVVLNDATFEEKFSLTLTNTNIWLFFSTIAVVLIVLTALAMMYTPLKYLVPGFGEYNYRSQIVAMTLKTDSLEKAMENKALWLHNFTNILTGKVDTTKPRTVPKGSFKKEDINLNEVSEEEKSLRKDVQEDDNYSLNYKHGEKKEIEQGLSQFHFFPPLNGYVTDDFDPKKEHFGIDIVSKQDEPVKATLEGTVISTSWTLTTGYVIAIQHSNELVSFYKHNSKLLKKEGTFVKAGDVIAMVGNSGEITTGPHLHFELWYKGKSVNPKNYIIF